MKRLDFLCISKEKKFSDRAKIVCDEFGYFAEFHQNSEEIMNQLEVYAETLFLAVDCSEILKDSEVIGETQFYKQACPNAYLMIVISSKMKPETTVFVKKSGANIVILENEFFLTSKFEFVASQHILTTFLPVKVADLKIGMKLDFNLYHLLPANRKFLPFLSKGIELSAAKLEKAQGVSELYINRSDVEAYVEFSKTLDDKSAAAMIRRCRADFMNMSTSFSDLILLISNQSEHASFELGRNLYDKCRKLAADLVTSASSIGEPWLIVNNSGIGQFGSADRVCSVAAYAGILSLMTNIGEPVDVMIAAMIADVGLLELSPSTTKKMRHDQMDQFTAEEEQQYQKHPIFSLNQALSRKLPIPEGMKQTILSIHERADGKGFPNRVRGDKITQESMVIQFCEIVDNLTVIKMGKFRQDIGQVRKKVFDDEFANPTRFNISFLSKIKPAI